MSGLGSIPIVNLPYKCAQDLQSTWVTNTTLGVAAGQCRDSTNTFDMVLPEAVVVDAGRVGANGIDTGTLAATKMYALFLIADVVSGNPTSALLSLSPTTPYLPEGYSIFRLIGWWATDGSSHFLLGYNSGNFNDRKFLYDTARATSITAGNATSYTLVDLSNLVPVLDNVNVNLYCSFTPGAAGRTLSLQPAGGTGASITVSGQVTSVVVTDNVNVVAKLSSAVPKIAYKVSNSGDAVALSVLGFDYSI